MRHVSYRCHQLFDGNRDFSVRPCSGTRAVHQTVDFNSSLAVVAPGIGTMNAWTTGTAFVRNPFKRRDDDN
jgi:hypothetical protein